jgi:drug/metabolite transporter (DMT)-like permease
MASRPDACVARRTAGAPQRTLIALAVVTTWLTTAGNFLAFKGALKSFPPLVLMSVRLLLAALVLVPIALIRQKTRPTRAQVGHAALAGCLLLFLGQGAIIWGVQSLPAGQTALFASSAPIFLALFSMVRGERLGRRGLIGIFLGVCGLALMAFAGRSNEAFDVAAAGIVLAGSAAWACGSMYAAHADLPPDAITSSAIQVLAASVLILPLAAASGEFTQFSLRSSSATSIISMAYLGWVGLALGISVFGWLNSVANPVVANTFQYVSPVIAVVAGALILGERMTFLDILAAVILLGSVALMATPHSSERRSET